MFRCDPAEGLRQQVEPFLGVEPREEEEHELATQLGVLVLEPRPGRQVIERMRGPRHWG